MYFFMNIWRHARPGCGAICPWGHFCALRKHSQWASGLQSLSKSVQNFLWSMIDLSTLDRAEGPWSLYQGQVDGATATASPKAPYQQRHQVPTTQG